MAISKANAADILIMKPKSVEYLIKKTRLVTVNVSGREMVTEESLFKEIGERYRRLGNALEVKSSSGNICRCGCGEETNEGKRFKSGHDQALEGIIRYFLLSGKK
ncbi:hypothetical protein [Paenibacillus hexagrammi]|uniref:Uncharacterized protein n=1 Tax=Paenibacillus hexagrammi TaxID=2908839 RepID=A0ABY3STX5_9BACL|nr:hypothetical protein [Paenibacillus sp. YPD9-1]UJF36591.1 hypothetical protein L0M14_30345 [Paenibacillus sp. YPD9-1]